MKTLLLKLKKKYCKHSFKSLSNEEYTGETLSWGLSIVHGFKSTYQCVKCGKQEVREYYYFGNIVNPDGSYNFARRTNGNQNTQP